MVVLLLIRILINWIVNLNGFIKVGKLRVLEKVELILKVLFKKVRIG